MATDFLRQSSEVKTNKNNDVFLSLTPVVAKRDRCAMKSALTSMAVKENHHRLVVDWS